MKKVLPIIVIITVLFTLFSCSNKIDSTEKLLETISDQYNGKWFKQVKFSQTTNFYRNDSIVKSERWIEEYVYPNQLIIKVNHENSRDGYLYRNDSMYIFEDNEIRFKDKAVHDLVILSMDIYNMTPEESMERFSSLDYDLSEFHTSNFEGRDIYVVGAEKGDTTSNQVWFDKEHLYFVKMVKNTDTGLQEVYFRDYINLNGKGWIEQEVVFYIDGKRYMVEKYYNITIPEEKKTKIELSDFNGFQIKSRINPIDVVINYSLDQIGVDATIMMLRALL